ncbi:MAG: hypothetical protein VXZ82_03830 [Planctomycetota bacterium]|nr:hypothetical protein [Planctomycetota bacterium]
MTDSIVVRLLIFGVAIVFAADLPAQTSESAASQRAKFNQVFVKLIVPVTDAIAKQDGPGIESWIKKRLKKLKVPSYFAVSDWVPVCDGLLADDIVDNDVWSGSINGHSFCPVGADIPKRKDGRMRVNVSGWFPGGCDSRVKLDDEPGSRAVAPIQVFGGKKGKPLEIDWPTPYVAVMVTPPPMKAK